MADSDILIRVRTDGVTGAEAALKRLGDVGVRTELVTDNMAKAFERSQKQINANNVAMRAMQSIGVIAGIAGIVGGLTKLNDQYTSLTNKLINANTANERLVNVQERVYDIAQRTRTGLVETATLYARVERSLTQYGATAMQVARITETVSKAMIVSGATTAEANAAIIQLSQGLQSGTLRGDEFRSVAEQAPRLLKAMADSLGVTTGELRAMSAQGKLTADVVAQAIFKASEAIDKEFGNTVATFSQKLTISQNNLIKFAGTSDSVAGSTSALGDVLVTLSNNLDVVATGVSVLAAAFTGRMITAMVASQAASLRVSLAQQQELATMRALTSARVQDAAAALQQATSTLAVAQAEKLAIDAAYQANQQYYKGIATTNALIQNNRLITATTLEVAAAQGAMNTAMAVSTTRAAATAAAITGLRFVMSALGGPAGIIMLAVGALYMWNEAQNQAIQNSRQLAVDTDTLTDRLSKLTTQQQQGLQIELQRAEIDLSKQLAKEKANYDSLSISVQNQIKLSKDERQSTIMRNAAAETANRLRDDAVLKNAQVSTTEQQLQSTRANLKTVTDNLANGERGLKTAVDNTNASMNLATKAATQRSDDLTKALQAQNSEAEVAQLKLRGNAKAASVLSDVQSRMPKVYAQNKKFIDDLIAGHQGLDTVMTNEQLGIKEFIDLAGKAFEAQEKLRTNKKDEAKGKKDSSAALRYEEQWSKAYERVEAKGATAIDRLRIQQESEVRQIELKASKAEATQEQLGAALVAIDQKYARERQKIADEYNPASKIATNYQEALTTIQQLQKADFLTEDQAKQARLTAEATYLQEKLRLAREYAVSQRELLQGEYDPVVAAENSYNQELAVLMTAHELQLMEDDRFYQLRHQAYSKFLQEQAIAQNQEVLNYFEMSSSMASSMAIVLEDMGAKNSSAYKAMFALSKGFAIAEASLKLTTAIAQAMADPSAITPAQKFANYAIIASAGASLIGQITSATMTGMAHDGITDIPKEGTWLLQKGERVLSAQQNADFTNFMRGGSSGAPGGAGGNITQYITVSGNGDEALTKAMQQAAADGAEQGYNKVLSDTTSRGNISRSIGR